MWLHEAHEFIQGMLMGKAVAWVCDEVMSLRATTEAGAGLGLDDQRRHPLVLRGGKVYTGDKNAGSFLKVPPRTQTPVHRGRNQK